MAIPGVSENKAVAIVKHFETVGNLIEAFADDKKTEKERKAALADVVVPSMHLGGKPSKVGKAVAERVFFYFMSVDPKLMITN